MQADILTFASMGCHPLSVITAITVQDSAGVEGMLTLDAGWVADQARCILEDIPVAAFKIGVLGSADVVAAIAEVIADYPDIPVVLDPVLASGRGDSFGDDETLATLIEMLIPQCTLITPNTLELRRLGLEDENEDDTITNAQLARRLLEFGCEYVLVTGTHDATVDVINTLYHSSGIVRSDTWQRLPSSYHGSGCTLASAVAASLARGANMSDAVREAQDYTWQTLKYAYRPGMGQFIPDRLFWAREETDSAEENGGH